MWDDPEVRPDVLPGSSLGKRRASKEEDSSSCPAIESEGANSSSKKMRRQEKENPTEETLSRPIQEDEGELSVRKFVDTCGEGEGEQEPVDFDEHFDDEDVL